MPNLAVTSDVFQSPDVEYGLICMWHRTCYKATVRPVGRGGNVLYVEKDPYMGLSYVLLYSRVFFMYDVPCTILWVSFMHVQSLHPFYITYYYGSILCTSIIVGSYSCT